MDRYYYWATLVAADTMRDRQQAASLRRLLASRRLSDSARSHRNNLLARARRRVVSTHANRAPKPSPAQLG